MGKLCQRHGATIMIATPTFVRSYQRRCEAENFKNLEVVFAGAEKLPIELADAFEAKFKVRPMEGYGATELSPVVAGNIPPGRGRTSKLEGVKEGTVGRPLPGIAAKVIDLDTGEDLGPNRTGMLLVKGPNVMKGYLARPDLTAEVIRDGWYITGDVAEIDEEGFIRVTGRVSRFSKIGGEMVPHIRVEEAINQFCRSTKKTCGPWLHRCRTPSGASGWWYCTPTWGKSRRRSAANCPRPGCRRCGFHRPKISAAWKRFPCWGPASWI